MLRDKVQKILDEFAEDVFAKARVNLKDSKNLANTFKKNIKATNNSISMELTMAEYGFYQDKGVSGVINKYDTPYSYKDKMPPPSKLDKWIVRKGLAPRQGGKFTGRKISTVGFKKSIQFLLARSIFMKGIPPSRFMTKAFESAFKTLPDELIEAYELEVKDLMDFAFKQNK